MKKLLPLTALCLLCSASAYAADGIINITGSITGNTCSVESDNTGYATKTVNLEPVSSNLLSTVGATNGWKAVDLSLTGCTGSSADFYFVADGGKVDSATGDLINTATTDPATNVQVQLTNSTRVALEANNTAQPAQTVDISSGSATISLGAQYIATGVATAGAVAASVEFIIAYK